MIIALIILILGSLIVSAIISPSLYYFLSNYVSGFSFPYSRLFDRVLMVVIFIFLLILKKHFNIKEAIKKFTEISKKCATKDFFVSFFITLSVCIILTLFLDMKDRLVWVPKTTSYYVSKIIKAFFAGVLISVLEESFFRVILLNAFKKKFTFLISAMLCSFCYMIAHFIAPAKSFTFENLTPYVGFEYYVEVIKTMFFPNIFCAFIGIFLVGFFLCYIINKFNSIYINIGIHSGFVMAMKLFIYSTGEATNVIMNRMERRYFLVEEPLGWLAIGLVYILITIVFSRSVSHNAK